MDLQAPRTPFSPARTNVDVSHRSGGPASAAKSKKPKQQLDRFIPSRSALDVDVSSYNLLKENAFVAEIPQKSEYAKLLEETLGTGSSNSRILAFKNKAPAPPEGHINHLAPLYTQNAGNRPAKKTFRAVPSAPERILDAPDLVDDYYLNLLDWSSTNVVAIALKGAVYLWNASTGSIETLMECPAEDDYITSVAWAADGKHVSVGTSSAQVQIWDVGRMKQIRALKGHSARVSALAWSGTTLSSGGRDSNIINHDVRIREHITGVLRGHEQEVCGLKWSPSGTQLASGGNDNLLHIWSATGGPPMHRMTAHAAAVKALAWCPFQSNLLASGGGTADRCIKFWNTHTGALLNSIDTGSQVCALQWSRHEKEILSSHGFSQNQLCLWKYPSMVKVAEMTGHMSRVLHLAQSPDGVTVCSAAADETLRFWKCFAEAAPAKAAKASMSTSASFMRSVSIR
ncbi:g8390 [Coccomyxa viridis]|uniref:G8390 protein n=1 Tax=Coccomyxa viridis TaxID=1274662 RepID=A0ABP1G2N3_9CHLO